MTVGERIVEARKAKDISQKQLAELAGIPLQTLIRYEKTVSENIPMGRLQAIADTLGVSPVYLIGWENKQIMTGGEMAKKINQRLLQNFTTQELLTEIERRCGE